MDDPVLDIFCEEARDHLAALEQSFLDLETAGEIDARRGLIDTLFRRAHTLKGDAKVVGLGELKHSAQRLEDVLDELRENPKQANRDAIDRGLAQFDLVRKAFENWESTRRNAAPAGAAPPVASPSDHNGPPPIEPHRAQASPSPATSKPGGNESFTVRVPSERLDRMLNLAGEVRTCQRSSGSVTTRLAELRRDLAALVKSLPQQSANENRLALEGALDQLRRIESERHKQQVRQDLLTESLEADIREARLLPLSMLTDSLRRAVRDLACSLGKSIGYEVAVGKLMLDKAVIESLKDPLLHMVRNAADHGIEPAPQRRAAGKAEQGMITITALRQGPFVQLKVADDGRGIDFARVAARILQRGELSETEVSALSERELAAYLFQPGFSTAPEGEVSGRGVGLDVARDAVRRLHGDVELLKSSSAGTTFTITVPVTVSNIRVLTVHAGGQYFGIATAAVRRTGRARRGELGDLNGTPILPINGQAVRWVYLSQWLGLEQPSKPQHDSGWSYLLVSHHGQDCAVAVDEIEDETEVLLKPLGFPLDELPGMMGATIRADGSAQLVLDLSNPVWTAGGGSPVSRHPQSVSRRILVADDSPTTRAVLRNVFTAAGYAVTTAVDGVDALEALKSCAMDLVVSDVEMPRLNGFDLTRQIKSKFAIPVILVTGREKEEHRLEGLSAGADAYIVKSTFEDQGLLQVVEQFL